MVKLPNLIIVGTVKGGTTSLFRYLSSHPEICASKRKETCYFLPLRYGGEMEPWSSYERLFDHCNDKQRYVMEATPGYFDGGIGLAEEIKKQLGDGARVIITLRNPMDRLVSFFRYKQAVVQLPKEMTISEYVTSCKSMPLYQRQRQENDAYWGVDGGRYMQYLPDWFSTFGRDKIKIVFFDSLANNPKVVMADLCNWLGIDASLYSVGHFPVENKTVPYRFAWMHLVAMKVNSRYEELLNGLPRLKRIARSIYYTLNRDYKITGQKPLTAESLDDLYASDNALLANFLLDHGYSDLPQWLSLDHSVSTVLK